MLNKDSNDPNENSTIKQRVENIRLYAAHECIAQIFGKDNIYKNFGDYLEQSFLQLITESFLESPKIPFRKKLLEIFAIGEWSKNPTLQANLSRTLLKCLYTFSIRKINEYRKEFPAVTLSRAGKDSLSDEAANLESLLEYLKNTLALKILQQNENKSKMSAVESAVDDVVTTVSCYFYDTCPIMLKKLIELIDQPFIREQSVLTEALKEAETRHEFLTSWCILFRPSIEGREQPNEKKQQEHAAGYVFL